MTQAPPLTVVIVSARAGALLDESFAAIAGQAAGSQVEIVIATRRTVALRFPPRFSILGARVLALPDEASIPELCTAAVQAATGRIVAVTNDHVVPDRNWIAAILRAHLEYPQSGVIGGAIERSATDTMVERAIYDCEYAPFDVSIPAGPCRAAPGANVSYARAALQQVSELLETPTWDVFWHQQMLRRGVAMQRDPRIVVRHRYSRTLTSFLRERYLFSRSLMGEQLRGATPSRRVFRALVSLMLPPLLLARLLRQVRATDDSIGRALMTVPLLALFTLPWSLGEVVGSLRGSGGATRQIE